MAATSATGTGIGAADNNKGPHNGRDIYVSNMGPTVVRCGSHALTSGSPSSATVGFPPLDGEDSDYIVVATPVGNTATIAGNGVAVYGFDASAGTFVLYGPNSVTTTMNWMIMKI